MEVDEHTVREAASVDEALRLIAEQEFDVVLSDVYMPGNGLELLRRVRRLSPSSSVVLLTGFDRPADEALAMDLGAFAYLRKPISLRELRLTIRGALDTARGEKDHP